MQWGNDPKHRSKSPSECLEKRKSVAMVQSNSSSQPKMNSSNAVKKSRPLLFALQGLAVFSNGDQTKTPQAIQNPLTVVQSLAISQSII